MRAHADAPRRSTVLHYQAAVLIGGMLLALTACGTAVSDGPSPAEQSTPNGRAAPSEVVAPPIPTIDPTSLASIVDAFEEVTGLAFESAPLSADLAALGVEQKLVGENEVARVAMLVLAEPRSSPADEERLLAGTEVGGTTETATYANHGRLFVAWRAVGDFAPLTQTDEDFLTPVDRLLEQVPLSADFSD